MCVFDVFYFICFTFITISFRLVGLLYVNVEFTDLMVEEKRGTVTILKNHTKIAQHFEPKIQTHSAFHILLIHFQYHLAF